MSKESNHLDKRIVFFDGACVLCNRFFTFLLRRDRANRLYFGTLQDPGINSFLSSKYINQDKLNSVLFYDRGKFYEKSTAAIRIVSNLGGIYTLIKVLYIFPKVIRDYIYTYIANNRYRWFGTRSCIIPNASISSRMISFS